MSVHNEEATAKAKKLLGIPEDEPIFILRAQDSFAPAGIRNYRNVARISRDSPKSDEEREAIKAWDEAVTECSRVMLQWQYENPDKVKQPD